MEPPFQSVVVKFFSSISHGYLTIEPTFKALVSNNLGSSNCIILTDIVCIYVGGPH